MMSEADDGASNIEGSSAIRRCSVHESTIKWRHDTTFVVDKSLGESRFQM